MELISFKYPNIVVTEGWLVNDLCTLISSCLEAYRMTGNLEMKLTSFNSDIVKTKDLLSFAEVLEIIFDNIF